MPATVRARAGGENPPRHDPRAWKRRYARSPMVAASHPTRPSDLLGDAALAAVVFALSMGLLAKGGSVAVDAPGALLTALATLPLVARRAAPLGVFVLTGVASAVLRGVAEP